ncbi:MAG: J domain-containing protein [Planctomycetes bacterium]|nr:J domain-containing protein [Planctomycetota bacterium]
MVSASPLSWPQRQPRTPLAQRSRGPFGPRVTVNSATIDVQNEIRLLRGSDLIVSTNLQLRIDGFPRSGQVRPEDPGVAVYFTRKGQQVVFACDRYDTVEHNLRAIAKHLDALRGMERWGVGTLDQAFAGYLALPEDTQEPWWLVLGFEKPPPTLEVVKDAFRELAKRKHPDVGGTTREFLRVGKAFDEARRHYGPPKESVYPEGVRYRGD